MSEYYTKTKPKNGQFEKNIIGHNLQHVHILDGLYMIHCALVEDFLPRSSVYFETTINKKLTLIDIGSTFRLQIYPCA